MLFGDTEAFIFFLFHGVIGGLLIYGLFIFSPRGKTESEMLLEENEVLLEKVKKLSGQNRYLEDVTSFQQETLQRAEARETKNQLTQEKLNGELVRRGSQVQSLERALLEERSKARDRR